MSFKNIIIVNDFAYINGGASKVALTSAIELARQGYNVYLFSAVGPVMEELVTSKVKIILLNQHEIADDPNRVRAFIQGIWNRKTYHAMLSLLAKLDPSDTIVHFHSWTKSLSSSVFAAVLESAFPSVVTIHDFFLACPNGGFFNYRRNSICKFSPMSWSCLTGNCDKRNYAHKLWRVTRQAVQKHSADIPGGMNHFITISRLSENIMRPFLPEDARLHRVSNPIFVDKQTAARPDNNDNFIYVGRLDPEKGAHLFAQVAERSGIKATFVGGGAESGRIKHILPDADLTGWLPADKVRAKLMSARALVFPSLWYETQGLTVMEAAALGIPAIVPDTSAAVEMIEDGVTGLIFKSGDIDDLTRKIKLLQNDTTVSNMGKAAYERYWRSPHTIEHHIEQLERVYGEIIGHTSIRQKTLSQLASV